MRSFNFLRTVATNLKIFFAWFKTTQEKEDLSKGYWNPKRKWEGKGVGNHAFYIDN